MQHSYKNAIKILNSFTSNQTVLRKSSQIDLSQSKRKDSKTIMLKLWQHCGYFNNDLNNLNIIHVTGTKGKGSTCEYCRSILQEVGALTGRNLRIGVFTSPHLRYVRERIKIGDQPISEEKFAKYFFELWSTLSQCKSQELLEEIYYFRFLTLLSWHIFIKEKVDTAIVEVGIGGEFDSTNIITKPSVAVVSKIGFDHVSILGKTLEEIAWQKSGIFKKNCWAVSVPQHENVRKVLIERAESLNAKLVFTDEVKLDCTNFTADTSIKFENAVLAIFATKLHLKELSYTINEPTFHIAAMKGIMNTKLEGKCQIVKNNNIHWCYDGAHTIESILLATDWFCKVYNQLKSENYNVKVTLIFNQPYRDYEELMKNMHKVFVEKRVPIHKAIFTRSIPDNEGKYGCDNTQYCFDGVSDQLSMKNIWQNLSPKSKGEVANFVEEAINLVKTSAKINEGHLSLVFVTGSIHLVGNVMLVNGH